MERSEKLKEMLTIKSNTSPKIEKNFKTHRIETSGILDRVKSFLPQLNEANDKLVEMEKSEVSFDVDVDQQSSTSSDDDDENWKETKPVVTMNLALFEYDDSNSCSSDDSSSLSSDSKSEQSKESNEEKIKKKKFRLKLPTDTKRTRSKDCPVEEIVESTK